MLIRSLAAGIMLAPAGRRVGWLPSLYKSGFGSIFVEPFVRLQRWPFSIGLNIFTRKLAGTGEVALVTWQIASALFFGLVVPLFFYVQPSLFDLLCLCVLGIVSAVAHMGVNRALRCAPAAVVVPYHYTLIVWAVMLGFLFFGDVQGWRVVMGSTIIVASGLYVFMREQVTVCDQAAEPP